MKAESNLRFAFKRNETSGENPAASNRRARRLDRLRTAGGLTCATSLLKTM